MKNIFLIAFAFLVSESVYAGMKFATYENYRFDSWGLGQGLRCTFEKVRNGSKYIMTVDREVMSNGRYIPERSFLYEVNLGLPRRAFALKDSNAEVREQKFMDTLTYSVVFVPDGSGAEKEIPLYGTGRKSVENDAPDATALALEFEKICLQRR